MKHRWINRYWYRYFIHPEAKLGKRKSNAKVKALVYSRVPDEWVPHWPYKNTYLSKELNICICMRFDYYYYYYYK